MDDKTIIKDICEEQEEIGMAVSTLAKLSQDTLARLDYLKRQDEIMLWNMRIQKYEREIRKLEEERSNIEQERQKAEQMQRRAEQEQRRAEAAEAENEKLRMKIAVLEKKEFVQKPD